MSRLPSTSRRVIAFADMRRARILKSIFDEMDDAIEAAVHHWATLRRIGRGEAVELPADCEWAGGAA